MDAANAAVQKYFVDDLSDLIDVIYPKTNAVHSLCAFMFKSTI